MATAKPLPASVRGSGVRADHRQAAVVVREIEAELGVVQPLGEIAEGDSPLAGIARVVVCLAIRYQELGIAA